MEALLVLGDIPAALEVGLTARRIIAIPLTIHVDYSRKIASRNSLACRQDHL